MVCHAAAMTPGISDSLRHRWHHGSPWECLVCPQQLNYNNKLNTHITLQVKWIRFKMELYTGFASFTERLTDYYKRGSNILPVFLKK